MLDGLAAKNPGPLPEEHLRAIWREIFSSSRALQRPQNVAYLGPEGTFSYFAGVEYLATRPAFTLRRYYPDFRGGQLRPVRTGRGAPGKFPPGTVGVSFDLFLKHEVFIQADDEHDDVAVLRDGLRLCKAVAGLGKPLHAVAVQVAALGVQHARTVADVVLDALEHRDVAGCRAVVVADQRHTVVRVRADHAIVLYFSRFSGNRPSFLSSTTLRRAASSLSARCSEHSTVSYGIALYAQFSSNSPSRKRVVNSRSAAAVMSSSVIRPASSAAEGAGRCCRSSRRSPF